MAIPNQRLIEHFDCTQQYPQTQYFENPKTKIISSSVGKYREADDASFSRFGYQFQIENIEKPHKIKLWYPDDKRRFMCIMDGTSYDLTTSAMTGFTQTLSHRMIEMEIVFWPRWKNSSIIFMTYGEGEPAAVERIEIYEMDSLSNQQNLIHPSKKQLRELGVQYEDPCGTAASEGVIDHAEWIEHVISYMKHTGQQVLSYPIVWYHGPLYPSNHEFSDGMDLVVAKDEKRTQYTRWITTPNDWYATLLKRFSEENLGFYGVVTLLRLSSLMKQMNTNLWKIRMGSPTINNMMFNNRVQCGSGDWTNIYNSINYNRMAKAIKPHRWEKGFHMPHGSHKVAYGETNRGVAHAGSIFNPLHPTVQHSISALVKEITERYAKFPSFKGISFNMYASNLLWFGSIHSGYDDYTISLFEKETKIHVPVHNRLANRFSKRYEYLNFVCREAWINWRCQKIHHFICTLRDLMLSIRNDLQLTITFWDETILPFLLGMPDAQHQIFARKSLNTLYQEAGMDLRLYSQDSHIEIDLGIGCTRDRGGHGKKPAGGITLPAEKTSMFRDHDFLDEETLNVMHSLQNGNAFIFNCWVEAWGKHLWSQCDPDDGNVAKLRIMDGKNADGILHINSFYPKDDFWWKSQLRIIPGLWGGVHFMEPYAHAVAEFDALRISRGGLFLDKGHPSQIQAFARNYACLPKLKFFTFGEKRDPVVLRYLRIDSELFFYFINRDYYPIEITFTLNGDPGSINVFDKANPNALQPLKSTYYQFTLGAYELRSFSFQSDVEIVDFTIDIGTSIEKELTNQFEEVMKVLNQAKRNAIEIPGSDVLLEKIPLAKEQKRYAWLRRAMNCYIVRKCQEIIEQEKKKEMNEKSGT